MKPLNNVKFYSLFRVFMIYIDFKYHPHKFAVDMVQRGDDFKKWYYESATGEMGYNDEPMGPYTDIDDFYKYYRECESENPLYIEGEKKLAEWMDRGVTIEEYLNEDRYTCSLNFTGPQEILDEIMNWDNGIADVHHKYFLRFWDEDNQHIPVQRATKKVNE